MLQKVKTKIYFISGLFFLILALVGIILPILPTTPFALLAIYFFDRSSEKFHNWVMKIPGVGEGIEDWQKHRVIRKKAKIQSTLLITFSGAVIALKDNIPLFAKVFTLIILVVVLVFLLTRRTDSKLL